MITELITKQVILSYTKYMFMKALLLVVSFVFSCTVFAQSSIENKSAKAFMLEAIAEGLKASNFSNKLAKQIAADNKLFVSKCQICAGVQNAFKAYAANTEIVENEKYQKEFADTSLKNRLTTLENLVQGFVQQYYVNHKYSKEQKIAMQQKLTAEAKKSKMIANVSYCASCTGSCKKPE